MGQGPRPVAAGRLRAPGSLKFGRGGDQKMAALLQLDPHTVARGTGGRKAENVSALNGKAIAPDFPTRVEQCCNNPGLGIDAREFRPFVGVAPVAGEREPAGIVGAPCCLDTMCST